MRKIEKTKTGANDKPTVDIIIADCGVEEVPEPFSVEKDDAPDN